MLTSLSLWDWTKVVAFASNESVNKGQIGSSQVLIMLFDYMKVWVS